MSVFNVIKLKAFIICSFKAFVANSHSRTDSNKQNHHNKNGYVFCCVLGKLTGQSLCKRIFHICHPLPIKLFGSQLVFIVDFFSDHTITELYHLICHILDSFVMCNHNNSSVIFLIDCFDKLKYFL